VLGVDADARKDAPWRDRGCPEADGVSDAADHARRPLWLAHRARSDRDGRVPELCKGLAGAAAGCHELAAANLDGVRDPDPVDVCFGRSPAILKRRESIKRKTIEQRRRLHQQAIAA